MKEITPQEGMPMWGYAFYHDALSKGVLDPLYANALVIQLGGKKLAIVSLDLGRPPAEWVLREIRQRIKAAVGIEYSFIAASHTHHGPVLELSDEKGKGKGRFDAALRYYVFLENAIVDVILEANRNVRPATMATGKKKLTDFNLNRQSLLDSPPSDRDVTVMRFDDSSGKPFAVLVNFAAHPTMVPEDLMKFSADYVGVLKQIVAEKLGVNVLFMQGAAGDQAAMGHGDYQSFGRDLAREVIALVTNLPPADTNAPSLELREKDFQFSSRVNLADRTTRRQANAEFFPELIANYAAEYANGVHPRLTVAELNHEIAFVGVSGEFFSEHSLRLKERARMKNLFFFGYCNGYDGYFPTIESIAEGGYGTDEISAFTEVGAGEEMMDTALLWLYEMRGEIKPAEH